MSKLNCYRFDETCITWMHSYLTGRYQCVQIRNNTSSLAPISFGVPQGSILGPLLFILFVNDLPLHSNQNLDLYADDSTLHSSGNSIKELNNTLSSLMSHGRHWTMENASNRMVVNCKKTKSMVICTFQKSAKIGAYELCTKHKNTVLENVKSEKLLGVKIDNHLS
jgi:hypothetical protein